MSEKESREKKKEEEEKEWRVKGSVRAKCCRGEDRDPTAPALSQISAPNHRRRLSYPSLLRLCPLHSALHWRPRCQWWLTPVDSMLLLLLRWSTPWLLLPSYPLPVKFDSAIPCYDQTTVLCRHMIVRYDSNWPRFDVRIFLSTDICTLRDNIRCLLAIIVIVSAGNWKCRTFEIEAFLVRMDRESKFS